MSRPRIRRVRAALAGVGLSAALLAGCSAQLPQPEPDAVAETPPPALDEDRLARVLEDVQATVAEADEARDPELLKPRVGGPALDMRAAEYKLADATDGKSAPDALTTAPQVAAVPATEGFPRPVVVISQVPEGANLPLLLVLEQSDARDQYRLWGWVTLFPGIETPAMSHPDAGSAVVPADADNLVVPPSDVVARYVDTLNKGDSEYADQFADDPYKKSRAESTAELDKAIEAAGEAKVSAEPGNDGPLSLATADGGAIVVGELRSNLTLRKTVPGSELRAGGTLGALLGSNTEVLGTVTGASDVLMAFYVPPSDADDKTIRPLGATTVLMEVTRDDAAAPAEG
ncbi:hypothetical protein ATJ97_3250 [Georgenia soli]|uniref:DUF8094 domain-containing protein n=1 Tax=Georgenia soli TaxID=638953 RepID=A0A2A9ENP8_9MICO|nr:hypothetical protein [Georgenia soli]PFG40717.1 hypothetical protein ATJ97_3250 [Georgenia soli]